MKVIEMNEDYKSDKESLSDKPLVSFDYAIKYLLRDKSDYDIYS